MTATAILVDDEANLLASLGDKLARLWPELAILGTAQNGRQAIALARETQPDIAFLDIHMPGLSGLEVAEALPESTRIVFVTAYDQFAVTAFDRAAIDYVLKPVSDARLEQTINRLKSLDANNRDELLHLLKSLQPTQSAYLTWIRAGMDDTTTLIPVTDVVYFRADQKYTSVMTADAEHLVRRSIKDLEAQLDPERFWRVHRGIVVNVEQIVSARRDLRGRYTLTLKDRDEKLRTSQSYGHRFKQM